eukprot:g2277.t1
MNANREVYFVEFVMDAVHEASQRPASEVDDLHKRLKEKTKRKLRYQDFRAVLPKIFSMLNMDLKTVVLAHVLSHYMDEKRFKLRNQDRDVLESAALTFFDQSTTAVQKCQAELRDICLWMLEKAKKKGSDHVMALLQPLMSMLKKSVTRASCLTTIHTLLLQACLITKCYHIGLRVLDTPVYEVMPKSTGFKVEDYNCFWYYAARVYIGCKLYRKAKRALLECIATPCAHGACSAVAVTAYRYLILVCLISDGAAPKLSQLAFREGKTLKACTAMYGDFADIFESMQSKNSGDNLPKLKAFVEKHKAQFIEHQTLGLALRCLKECVRHKIASQTMTYLTLSMSDLAENAGCTSTAEAEGVILDMIRKRQISASIDGKSKIVAFIDDKPLESGSAKMPGLLEKISAATVRMLSAAQSLIAKDEALSSNDVYVRANMPLNAGNHRSPTEAATKR